ncbi:MAG: ATP-binding cassette domain-containing protein [Porticoccaceae bacterium]|nr:ATP-binding cassette domain-containing protein [Porticoccaceae bacterium]
MTNNPILIADSVVREYSQGEVSIPVLSGVNLSVGDGEKVAIVGASGSGKTTLLNLLGGLDDPDKGRISVNGKSWTNLGASERAIWRNQHIGFVYQFHHLLNEFSALENVALPLLIGDCSVNKSRQQATSLLERVGLGHRLNHTPAELSGGERQRVAVARALVNEPSVVLMDEPTGNLDPITAKTMLELLIDLNQSLGIAFVLVTHDDNIARQMDRTVILEMGQLKLRESLIV